MKSDIENAKDIKKLIDTFYDKVKADAVIGYIFNDVAKVNWEQHLPVMYKFWENVVFFSGGYSGNPMMTHLSLHQKTPLTRAHFEQWLRLFIRTVDELFEGEKATAIKTAAIRIATLMRDRVIGPQS